MPIIEVVAPTASIEGPKAHAEQSRPATLPAELPFRLLSGYLIEVEGRIGTQNKLRFILDTGTTRTIIDQGIAGKLELDRRKAQSFNFDRKLNWESTSVPELQVGPVHATNIPVFVGRLAEYSEFAKNADAIIGMDVLRFSDFSIDYGTKKIVFHSGQRDYTPPADEPLSECVILELLVQGHPVRVVVDTGFPGLLLYEERIRSKVPALRTTGRPTAVSIGGRLQAKQVMLPDVVFGARNDEVSVLLVKAPSPDTLPGIDGVVGLTPLKAHRVHLDLVGKGLSWE